MNQMNQMPLTAAEFLGKMRDTSTEGKVLRVLKSGLEVEYVYGGHSRVILASFDLHTLPATVTQTSRRNCLLCLD